MSNALIPFKYQGVRLNEACWMGDKPYFTFRAIGEWLEVRHPDRYVHKLVERNPHILQFATTVKLKVTDEYLRKDRLVNLTSESPPHPDPLPNGERESILRTREIEVQVIDPIGVQLVMNKSNQPKAIAFQVWAANLVLAYTSGQLKPVACFDGFNGILGIPSYFHGRGKAVDRLAAEQGISRQTVYVHLKRLSKGEPIYRKKRHFRHRKYEGKYKEFLALKDSLNGVEIAERLQIPQSTVYSWRQRYVDGR